MRESYTRLLRYLLTCHQQRESYRNLRNVGLDADISACQDRGLVGLEMVEVGYDELVPGDVFLTPLGRASLLVADRPITCRHNNPKATCEVCFGELRRLSRQMAEAIFAFAKVAWSGGDISGADIQEDLLKAGLLRERSAEEIEACVAGEGCTCAELEKPEEIHYCTTLKDELKELLDAW